MDYNISEHQNIVVIAMEGNLLGGPDGTRLHDTLRQLKDEGKPNVVADLSGANFMSSSGLGMLISGLTTLRNAGGDFRLACVPSKLQALLKLTRLNTVFKEYDDVDEAVVSFTSEPAGASFA
ncbi:MAG TPA: STAS domain-containing protein [Rhodothermales bacterium]|nr:STAS domain-containing protein [Rhodothermales bacterium]